MCKYIKNSDYFRNKDRQDPVSVLPVTWRELVDFHVIGPIPIIIPETLRILWEKDLDPISIAMFYPGLFPFLTQDYEKKD